MEALLRFDQCYVDSNGFHPSLSSLGLPEGPHNVHTETQVRQLQGRCRRTHTRCLRMGRTSAPQRQSICVQKKQTQTHQPIWVFISKI